MSLFHVAGVIIPNFSRLYFQTAAEPDLGTQRPVVHQAAIRTPVMADTHGTHVHHDGSLGEYSLNIKPISSRLWVSWIHGVSPIF